MHDSVLLELIYRSRPATVADLIESTHLPEGEITSALDRLTASGAVSVRDGALTYRHPADLTADLVAHRIEELRTQTAASLAQIEQAATDLPPLLRHWSVGESTTDLLPALRRHGRHAAEDLWIATGATEGGTSDAVFPDVSRFLDTDPHRSALGRRRVAAAMDRYGVSTLFALGAAWGADAGAGGA